MMDDSESSSPPSTKKEIVQNTGDAAELLKTKWRSFFNFLKEDDGDYLTRHDLEAFVEKLSEAYNITDRYYDDLYNGVVGWWHVIKRCYGNEKGRVTSDQYIHAMTQMYNDQKAAMLGYTKEFSRVLFDAMDDDKDGLIDANDYLNLYSVLGYDNVEFIQQSFGELDVSLTGKMRRRQYQRAVLVHHMSDEVDNSNDFMFACPSSG